MKLFNQGQRTIHFQGGSFAPKQCLDFSNALPVGQKLKRLFPDELMDLADQTKVFEAAEAVTAPKAEAPATIEKSLTKEEKKAAKLAAKEAKRKGSAEISPADGTPASEEADADAEAGDTDEALA